MRTMKKVVLVLSIIVIGLTSCVQDDNEFTQVDRFQGEWLRKSYTVLMSTGEYQTFEYQEGQAKVFLNVTESGFEWITESGIDGVADYTLIGTRELGKLFVDGVLTFELEASEGSLKWYDTENKDAFFATYKLVY